ncbi:MAG: Hsp33 family molecular chaperone HslO [Ectothiorhodospiraceae bacterium]
MSGSGDTLHRFFFEHADVRGELIQIDQTLDEVLGRRSYPDAVNRLVGEALAAAGLLSAIIKFRGSLILQIQGGEGPLRMLVASANHEQTMRGLARLGDDPVTDAPLHELCGGGYLAITIDPSDSDDRYQGIVPVESERLDAAVAEYFAQSEQLPTRVWLACDGERAAGLLLQRLPAGADSDPDAWERAGHLAATVTRDELLHLGPEAMLQRLFHEESIRLMPGSSVRFGCHCTRERLGGVLQGMGHAEMQALLAEQGHVEATCEFCGTVYRFDAVDVEQLFHEGGSEPPDDTRH